MTNIDIEPALTADDLSAAIAPPGLKGLIVTTTSVGDVRGEEGFFHYRGHAAPDLARKSSFEEVWHLFDVGRLPSTGELTTFEAETAALRSVPTTVTNVMSAAAALHPTPMDVMRLGLAAAASAAGDASWLDLSPTERRSLVRHLGALTPSIAAAAGRIAAGEEIVASNPKVGLVHDYLTQLTGETPDGAHVRAVTRYLVLTIDHGLNASTFACRVVTSTGAGPGAALVAAHGALSGPLHGGAPALALDMLREIGEPRRAAKWVREALEHGRKIMGFGHAVYRTADPRSELMKETAMELGGEIAELAVEVEPIIIAELERHRPGARIATNIELFAGVVMDQVGIPGPMMTPTFASSRAIGWLAHATEQMEANKIMRPSSRYVGPII